MEIIKNDSFSKELDKLIECAKKSSHPFIALDLLYSDLERAIRIVRNEIDEVWRIK